MDYYRSFKWILQQLKIAVGLPLGPFDFKIIQTLEEERILDSFQQSFGVFLDIIDDGLKFVGREQIAVVKVGGEDVGYFGERCPYQLSGLHFHHSDISSESTRKIIAGKDGEMDMIRHDDILENLQGWVEIWEVEDLLLDNFSDNCSGDQGTCGRAGNFRERGTSGGFADGDMIDGATSVVMLRISAHR